MEITQEKNGNINIIKVKGRLDASTSSKLEEALDGYTGQDKVRVLVDCQELDYISSAGLRVLLSAAKDFQKHSGKICLATLNANVKQVFEISGFTSIFPIYASTEEAVTDMS